MKFIRKNGRVIPIHEKGEGVLARNGVGIGLIKEEKKTKSKQDASDLRTRGAFRRRAIAGSVLHGGLLAHNVTSILTPGKAIGAGAVAAQLGAGLYSNLTESVAEKTGKKQTEKENIGRKIKHMAAIGAGVGLYSFLRAPATLKNPFGGLPRDLSNARALVRRAKFKLIK